MTPSQRSQVYRVAAAVFGVALVAAGGLKLLGDGSPVESPVTAALPVWAAGLVPFGELALGGWLLSGRARFGAWLVAVPTLLVFALHSLLLTAGGESSCGCLGKRVTVPPVVTLAFDVCLLALMVRCRPGWRGWPAADPGLSLAARTAAVAAAVLLAAAGCRPAARPRAGSSWST